MGWHSLYVVDLPIEFVNIKLNYYFDQNNAYLFWISPVAKQ